jgi:hypothetical protein
MNRPPGSILLLDDPVRSLDDYVEGGGGRGLTAALDRAPEDVSKCDRGGCSSQTRPDDDERR